MAKKPAKKTAKKPAKKPAKAERIPLEVLEARLERLGRIVKRRKAER